MLHISQQLASRLHDQGITRQAVQQAFEQGCAAGMVLADQDSGCLVTHAQLDNLTMWVRYRQLADGDAELVDAYYHRMQVL